MQLNLNEGSCQTPVTIKNYLKERNLSVVSYIFRVGVCDGVKMK